MPNRIRPVNGITGITAAGAGIDVKEGRGKAETMNAAFTKRPVQWSFGRNITADILQRFTAIQIKGFAKEMIRIRRTAAFLVAERRAVGAVDRYGLFCKRPDQLCCFIQGIVKGMTEIMKVRAFTKELVLCKIRADAAKVGSKEEDS